LHRDKAGNPGLDTKRNRIRAHQKNWREKIENGSRLLSEFPEGFSLHPEDWSKNQQTLFPLTDGTPTATPIVSPPNDPNPSEASSEKSAPVQVSILVISISRPKQDKKI
jgi:hypothetical protein